MRSLLVWSLVGLVGLVPAQGWANAALLAWDASVTPEVTGYRLYYGTAPRTYTHSVDVGQVLTGGVPHLVPGTTYYFAATAYTATMESVYSNEVAWLVPLLPGPVLPGPPQALRLVITIEVPAPRP